MKRFSLIFLFLSAWSLAVHASTCVLHQAPYLPNTSLPEHDEGYVKTSGGSLFFRYAHHRSGPLVILVPGLPSAVYYADLFGHLEQTGYNVLSFDFPGKTNSELLGKADLAFLSAQTMELFENLHLADHSNWHLVGTSMGAVMAAELALRNRSRVRSLSLLNPVGLKHDWTILQRIALVPVLSQILAPFILPGEVKKDLRQALACPENYENLMSEQEASLKTWTERWNYLNLIAHFGMAEHPEVYEKLAGQGIHVLVTSGQSGYDPLVQQVEQLKLLLPTATYMSIAETSHIPFIENPKLTFDILKNFFERNSELSAPNADRAQ